MSSGGDRTVANLHNALTSPGNTSPGETEHLRSLAFDIDAAVRENQCPADVNKRIRAIIANLKQNDELRQDVIAGRRSASDLATVNLADLRTKERKQEDRTRQEWLRLQYENAGKAADVPITFNAFDNWSQRSPSACQAFSSIPSPAYVAGSPQVSPHFDPTGGGHDFDTEWQRGGQPLPAGAEVQVSGDTTVTGSMAVTMIIDMVRLSTSNCLVFRLRPRTAAPRAPSAARPSCSLRHFCRPTPGRTVHSSHDQRPRRQEGAPAAEGQPAPPGANHERARVAGHRRSPCAHR